MNLLNILLDIILEIYASKLKIQKYNIDLTININKIMLVFEVELQDFIIL